MRPFVDSISCEPIFAPIDWTSVREGGLRGKTAADLEAEEIRSFDKDLAAIVKKWSGTWWGNVIGVAGAAG